MPRQERVKTSGEYTGWRLDQAAAAVFPDYSRGRLQQWIRSGALQVDGETLKPKHKLAGGEVLTLLPDEEAQGDWRPEAIPLNVVFEDDHLMVVDKPPDLVVHPAAGNDSGTLLNALLHRVPTLANLPRAGIVHRLDKDTTGLMVVAKSHKSHRSLVSQLQARTVRRVYQAVVRGCLLRDGSVEAPVGRHPRQRKKMAVVQHGGKEATTHYRPLHAFAHFSYLEMQLETGRTHQIRVHMAHLGYPLAGDSTYGGRRRLPKDCPPAVVSALADLGRQALHAGQLALEHPETGDPMVWDAPLPADMQTLVAVLQEEDTP